MSHTIDQIPDDPNSLWRLLVLAADTEAELTILKYKASRKGWWPYFDGHDPSTGKLCSWMRKPLEQPPG